MKSLVPAIILMVALVALCVSPPANVHMIIVHNSSCSFCAPASGMVSAFRAIGLVPENETYVEYSSQQGMQLAQQFGLKRIPSIIATKNIRDHENVSQVWDQLSAYESGDYYVIGMLQAPYLDIEEGRVVGITDVIYINDSSCRNCYDVTIQSQILQGAFGVLIRNETFFDFNNSFGRALVSRYNITKVPTVLVSEDAKYYAGLVNVWTSVGTIEDDGWFVFRNVSDVGTYRDLQTGKVVVPVS